jgi:hypothetical protein
MKYLITETKFNSTIERFIKESFPYVVSVSFVDTGVWLAQENKRTDRTLIIVIVDPYNILHGNINGAWNRYDNNIRREIWNSINSFFNLELDKYGSKWDLNVYGINLTSI